MKSRVYVETTVPSFYHEERPEPEMVARRGWTREWWDNCHHDYELVTSIAVVDELNRVSHPNRHAVLTLMSDLPFAPIDESMS